MQRFAFILLILTLLITKSEWCVAQREEIVNFNAAKTSPERIADKKKDTALRFIPRKAIIRSAIIPGWGQVYNKKYWKVPIVYGALGITTSLFFRNIRQYKEARDAYILATDADPSNDNQIQQPYYNVKDQPERIRTFRNAVRQNVDYCVLFFIAFWGLNVADAAVDSHLKSFDVSDDLSLQIKAGHSSMANTNGVSLVLKIGK
jgi:hypothetical protein